jgi:hypothetical protein
VQWVQGPVLAPNRVLGLGGAYGGYAEGVEGTYANTAAPAVREPFSLRWIDYDVSGSFSQPGFFSSIDFENRPIGSTQPTSALYAGLSGMVQVGRFGASLSTDVFTYRLNDVRMQMGLVRVIAAYALLDGQIAIGVGVRGALVHLAKDARGSLLISASASPEAGVLVRKNDQPWRLGVTLRAPVVAAIANNADPNGPPLIAGGLVLPKNVILPAELEAAVAVQLGPRPLNPKWVDPSDQEAPMRASIEAARAARKEDHARAIESAPDRAAMRERLDREEDAIRSVEDDQLRREAARLYETRRARYLNWPRTKLLVVAGVLVTAPVTSSVSVTDFLNQQRNPYGDSWTVSPRYGLEGEPIPDWLMLRVGGYLEPARLPNTDARQHVTFGADLKLFSLAFFPPMKNTVLRLTSSFDFAPRYTNWGVGIGVWH